MYHHRETHDNPCRPEIEVLSATRPPQLNQAICRCSCMRKIGDAQRDSDNGRDDDAASTLVGSEVSDMVDDISARASDTAPDTTNMVTYLLESVAHRQTDQFRARIGLPVNEAGEFAYHATDGRSHFDQGGDDTNDSLCNWPGSDNYSTVTSEARSMRAVSPGPLVAHAGGWASLEYYFLERPLRLTPQHQFCRGRVASHLVLRDEATVMDADDGLLGNGNGVPSHLEWVWN